jgi:tetratricopeptide (TPR) repeat protein
MKTFIMTLLVGCVVVIAGAIIYLDHQKGPPAPKPVAEASASQPAEPTPPENVSVPAPQSQPAVVQQTNTPASVAVSSPSAPPTTPADSASPAHKTAKALLSAKSAAEKQAILDELRKDGQSEAVIADLKQMAAANPSDPEIPTTIGEAELNEIRAIKEDGTGNEDQMGILAMQADQEFNAALQIDPQNWEAQFVKYSTMYYWPSNPQRDGQVVQNLTSLIDQQGNMPANPAFAQTYLMLGNEYQKIGQSDKAMATWQLGAQQFPSDSALQKKLAGQ